MNTDGIECDLQNLRRAVEQRTLCDPTGLVRRGHVEHVQPVDVALGQATNELVSWAVLQEELQRGEKAIMHGALNRAPAPRLSTFGLKQSLEN